MRFLYAMLCVLLIAWAAYGQYTVENKVQAFTVVSKLPAPVVQANVPFPAAATTPGTTVRYVVPKSQRSRKNKATSTTTSIAAFPGGITTNLPVGCVGFV